MRVGYTSHKKILNFQCHIQADRLTHQGDEMRKGYQRPLPRKKRALKEVQGSFLENRAEERRVGDKTGQTHKTYHLIMSFDNKSKTRPGTTLSKEGDPITATAKRTDRWLEHFKALFNRPPVKPVQTRLSLNKHFLQLEQPHQSLWKRKKQCIDWRTTKHMELTTSCLSSRDMEKIPSSWPAA